MSESSSKRGILERLLEHGRVLVELDPRSPGVDVPARFKEEATLRLRLSYRFGPTEVNDWGVHATLTFSGVPHACKLPWSAIYHVLSEVTAEEHAFPEDIPEELVRSAVNAPRERPDAAKPRPRLSLVHEGDEDLPEVVREDEPPPPDGAPPPAGPPRLRRIK